ncbi:MAG TPA: hypothetical protein VIV09_02525 [Pseudolabrys sp.]
MRPYREQDFDQMATRVVDRFMSGQKLADVAAQEAQQSQLNPDQIERLTHSANTMAFLRLMEQQKAQGQPDMTGEFDPIDARQIMQLLMQQTDVPHMDVPPPMEHHDMPGMGGMSDEAMPLPDEMGGHGAPHAEPDGDEGAAAGPPIDDDNDGPFPKGKKQKDKDDGEKKDKAKKAPPGDAKKDEAKEAAFRARRMRKLAETLEDQLKQAELLFDDEFTSLQAQLRRAHGAPSAAAFEKDALALHGDDVGMVVLGMVQESRGWPVTPADVAHTKTAALADRHLVDENETNQTFSRLVKIATEAARLKQGAEFARAQCS